MLGARRKLCIRPVAREYCNSVHTFHVEHVGDELWPRTRDEFTGFVESGSVFAVFDESDGCVPIGVSYIHVVSDRDWELGGLFVLSDYQGAGIGTALARAAIASQFLWSSATDVELTAHVLEPNDKPRGLLRRLGFLQTGKTPPVPDAPLSMRRNRDGEVVGDIFKFQRIKLNECADWFESFRGEIGAHSLAFEGRAFEDLHALAVALRDFAN